MNDTRLQAVYNEQWIPVLPIKTWMRLEIHEMIGDEGNQRIWKFRGLVLKVHKPNHPDGTFTIRGQAARHTIEKIYPLSFPKFKQVILMDEHKVRRSKLYYMRNKIGKSAKLKSNISAERRNIDLNAEAQKQKEVMAQAQQQQQQ